MRRRGAGDGRGANRLHHVSSGDVRASPHAIDDEDDQPAAHSSALALRGWDGRSARAFAVVMVALMMVAGWWWWSGRADVPTVVSQILAEGVPVTGAAAGDASGPSIGAGGEAASGSQSAAAQVVVVHVAGAVRTPGLVELPWGSRVSDAIAAADGATSPEVLTSVNLARPLVDGEQILVGVDAAQPSDGRISINSASSVELQELPGVGPVLAERIVAFREQNGPFVSLDGLLEVSGIGEAVLRNMSEQVRM